MIAIANAEYIYGTYAITALVLGGFVAAVLRRGRALSKEVDDSEKYWA